MEYGKWAHVAAFLLVVVGALNWGLVGLLNFNVVKTVVGVYPTVESLVYVLVGAAAVYLLVVHKDDCKICSKIKM